jgi:hypothetical protein
MVDKRSVQEEAMKRWNAALPALAATLICAAVFAAPALAASSPTVTTGGANDVTDTSAVLQATIGPNGSTTTYYFQYGPTSALGTMSGSASAGGGTATVTVQATVSGLIPGTTYYYRVYAGNSLGAATGATKAFKTGGTPPPSATTGGVANLSTSTATLTGLVYPQGQPTTYYFRYGLTTAYGLQTGPDSVAAGTAPVTVSITVPGLLPGATFHYQLVAQHSGGAASAGADMSFETFPSPAPLPTLTVSATPRNVGGSGPFTFTTTGTVVNPSSSTPPALACTGSVVIGFVYGRTTLVVGTAPVTAACTYTVTVTLARRPGPRPKRGHKRKPVRVAVYARFTGNNYLAATGAQRLGSVTLH